MHQALAYADGLHNFAYHLTRNAAEAQDLTQETYARALGAARPIQRRDEPQGVALSHPSQYVHRSPSTRAAQAHRRGARHRPSGPCAEPTRGAEPRQVQEVVGRELERAMGSLTEEARLAVLLDLEGFSEAEMAECWAARRGR